MDNRTLILQLLKADEITYVYLTDEEAVLNKWNSKKKAENIPLTTFRRLEHFNIIELTSGNFENGERHYQLVFNGDIIKTLNECVLKTTKTEFETIFKDILLKVERRKKLQQINENSINR